MADDGQIDQAADDVVAEYSRLPAGRAFIDRLDGFGFNNSDVTVFCRTAKLGTTITGAKIDFADTIESQGFTIDNPNAGGSCACGDSFN